MGRLLDKVCRVPRAATSPSMAEKDEKFGLGLLRRKVRRVSEPDFPRKEPRGGFQSEEYRKADPRDLVQEGDTVMSGPGGAPQEGESVEERRARDRGES